MFVFCQKRSVEDLKERYYSICGKLTKVRAASGTEPKIYIFDAGHERRRKEQLEKLFNRTPEQVCDFCILTCIYVQVYRHVLFVGEKKKKKIFHSILNVKDRISPFFPAGGRRGVSCSGAKEN